MSVVGTARILEEYDEKCELYEAFAKKLDVLICELLITNGLNVVSVTNRLKEKDKLETKIKKVEDRYSCLGDVTDVSGLRIITYFADDVDRVAEIIESEFEIDHENSVDKREIMLSNKFGYMSLHFVVSLPESRVSHSENQRFRDCKAEVQIRSILQHAWAEIEHDLGYKTEKQIPQQTRRRFTRIAGLLEVADSEFDAIRVNLTEYRETIGQRIIEEPAKVLIDNDSLMNFTLNSPLILSITQELAEKSNNEVDFDVHLGKSYVDGLFDFGIETISELETSLESRREIIVKFAVDWLTDPTLFMEVEEELGRSVDLGITIFYLLYVLCGEYGKNDLTNSHLRRRFPMSAGFDESFIDQVFSTYDRLIQT